MPTMAVGIEKTFGIEKEGLDELLREVGQGKLQLPDFQRDWVWDDVHVRSVLASVSLSYPIGTLMLLQTGDHGMRLKQRPIEGAVPPRPGAAGRLVLDGQQRLTALYQSLELDRPVKTRDQRRNQIERWYYIDMEKALDPKADREETILALPADRVVQLSQRGAARLLHGAAGVRVAAIPAGEGVR